MPRRKPDQPTQAELAAIKPPSGPLFGADAARAALRTWAQPMARMALQAGLNHAQLDELWRMALVQAASEQQSNVSQVSVTTGLHRKEVMRLQALLADEAAGQSTAPKKLPWASQLILKWADWVSRSPNLGVLPLLADDDKTPSFAKLSRSVTTDVHPRAVLQELLRLGLVAEQHSQVSLLVLQFVPKGSADDALGVLTDNLGDHLQTGLHNIALDAAAKQAQQLPKDLASEDDGKYLEQAIWAEGISHADVRRLNHTAKEAWAQAYRQMYKQLLEMPEAPAGQPRYRVRVGMFAAAQVQSPSATQPTAEPTTKGKSARKSNSKGVR